MGAPRKAIILGGNADQVPLIQALGARGYRTVLIDYYPDPPGKAVADVHHQVSTLDVDAVSRVVDVERPAFLTSIGNDLVVPVLAQVSERYGLPCTQSYADSLKATNKALMKAAFREHGIPTARQFAPEEYTGPERAELPFPLIGKLLVGYGARGVRRLADAAALDAYLAEYQPQGDVLVEAFIEGGAELSVDCFAVDGRAMVLLASRLHQVPDLPQQFSNLLVEFPYVVPASVQQELQRIAQRMSVAFGIANGPFFFQAKLKDGDLQVIEMGARIAGGRKFSAVKVTTGFDPLEAQLDVLEGRAPAVQVVPVPGYHLTVMLFAKEGQVEQVHVPAHAAVHSSFQVKAAGYRCKGTGSGDERVAVFSLIGRNREDAFAVCRRVLEGVRMPDPQGQDLFWRELYTGVLD